MLPFTPPVEVVYVDIGVFKKAFVLARVATELPRRYRLNRLKQLAKAYPLIYVRFGKLKVLMPQQFKKA